MSADDVDTLRKFRAQHAPRVTFVSDAAGALMQSYGVKAPVLTLALRTTFVINQERRVVAVLSGSDAIEAQRALDALLTSPAPPSSRPSSPAP